MHALNLSECLHSLGEHCSPFSSRCSILQSNNDDSQSLGKEIEYIWYVLHQKARKQVENYLGEYQLGSGNL